MSTPPKTYTLPVGSKRYAVPINGVELDASKGQMNKIPISHDECLYPYRPRTGHLCRRHRQPGGGRPAGAVHYQVSAEIRGLGNEQRGPVYRV